MKKLLSLVPFILACCLLIGAVGWGIFGVYDTYREVQRLKDLPGASGVDYLGVHMAGVVIGIGMFPPSVGGMIFSGISHKVNKQEKLHTASGVLMILFGVLLFVSVVACMWRWF